MPFGLTNAPVAVMDLMNRVFKLYLVKFFVVFANDILIYSKSREDHEEQLLSLQLLRSHWLYAKFSKSDFWLGQITLLGHVISQQGALVDPAKIEVIVGWPRPTTVAEMRSFLGPAGYYRRFIKDFSSLTALLTKLTRKDEQFVWTEECESSF